MLEGAKLRTRVQANSGPRKTVDGQKPNNRKSLKKKRVGQSVVSSFDVQLLAPICGGGSNTDSHEQARNIELILLQDGIPQF